MCDMCGDDRFEIIEAYKRKLIEATNIETSPEEMAVIDNILLRFWQMGWLSSAQPETEERTAKSVQNVSDSDLISRKAAIELFADAHPLDYISQAYLEKIRAVPSAQPERKKGHWQIYIISMLDGEGCKCSECGHEGTPYWDFCPNCGAEMEGVQDETD